MALYAAEGVPCPPIVLTDNADCVALIDAKPEGLISLLEDECNLPKPSDSNLITRMFAAHATHVHLQKPSRPGGKRTDAARIAAPSAPQFTVVHFAGSVNYDANGFVVKNSDSLHVSSFSRSRAGVLSSNTFDAYL